MSRFLSLVIVAATLAAAGAGDVVLNAAQKRILELTNQERKQKELPPLKPNALPDAYPEEEK